MSRGASGLRGLIAASQVAGFVLGLTMLSRVALAGRVAPAGWALAGGAALVGRRGH